MEDNNHKTQFHAVLADPASVGADALAALVARYPYAQSLRVAQARQGLGASAEGTLASLPLLYIGAPHRLRGLLGDAVKDGLADSEDEDDILLAGDSDAPATGLGESPTEAVGEASELPTATPPPATPVFQIDDPEAEAADQILEANGEGVLGDAQSIVGDVPAVAEEDVDATAETDTAKPLAIETVVPDSHDDEQLATGDEPPEAPTPPAEANDGAIDADDEAVSEVLPEHAATMDYLAYEAHTAEGGKPDEAGDSPAQTAEPTETPTAAEEVSPLPQAPAATPTPDDQQIVPASQARPHEKMSVYDDEHLPYTFLWWLNKARMDHADTYQPYAGSAKAPAADDGSPARVGPADQVLLDQQIRENIFHLQPPEEKLTAGNDAQTVSFKVPKKTDPIIERFIREEPQIKPPNPDKLTLKNMAKHSAEDAQEIVTETLAKIYADQGHYNKAIDAYEKLSLKYPEKSSYFADRISELEKKFT